MQKRLTIRLDQEVYRRLCIVVGSDNSESCRQFIEKIVQRSVDHCYSPEELDAMYRDEGQDAAFQARMYARNSVAFANEDLEAEFQGWLAEGFRESEKERRLEEQFLTRLEDDYLAEYEDPVLESEFRKWLVEGRLWIMDDKLQKEAEFWAKTLVSGSDPS